MGLAVIVFFLFWGFVVILGIISAGSAMSESVATFTVTDKVGAHGDSGDYLIFTDKEVFTVEDNVFKMKFDATDRYNSIKIGKTYTVRTTGMRFHFFSWYRNIIEIKEV